MRGKTTIIALLLILALTLVAGCNSQDKVVGKVNGKEITSSYYEKIYSQDKAAYEYSQKKTVSDSDTALVAQLHDQAFDEIVNYMIIEQEAEKRGIKVEDSYIDGRLNYIKSVALQQGGEQNFANTLKSLNLTEDDLKYQLKIQKYNEDIKAQVTADVTVSEQEIVDYYNSNKENYSTEAGIQISHILVDSEAQAQDIIKQIQAGADFAEMAKQYSTCSSAANGGDLGITNENTNFVPEFKTAALALQPGEMTTTPVKSEFGYHIIKAGKRVEAGILSLEDARPKIEKSLKSLKADAAVEDYMKKLHDEAAIEDLRSK